MTNEILEKLKVAKSVEELVETAKAEGAEIAPDKAEELFAKLNAEGELLDDLSENIAGGQYTRNGTDGVDHWGIFKVFFE